MFKMVFEFILKGRLSKKKNTTAALLKLKSHYCTNVNDFMTQITSVLMVDFYMSFISLL